MPLRNVAGVRDLLERQLFGIVALDIGRGLADEEAAAVLAQLLLFLLGRRSVQALPYLLDEWSLGAASFSLQPAGMVRTVNVRQILLRAAYRGSGELRLRIRDALIPENDGVFSLRFADGRALSVERTDEEIDAAMSVASFSALIAGVCDFDGAKDWMDGVEVFNRAAPFERVFYRKSMMISEYF